MLDQEYGLIDRMEYAESVFLVYSLFSLVNGSERTHIVEASKKYPNQWEFFCAVEQLRNADGN